MDRYQEAKKRVKAKREFYQHLGTYVVMSAFFFLLNAVTSFGNWWFFWPMLGWGLAVVFHYVDVFGIPGFDPMTPEWEEREIQKELQRLDRERERSDPQADAPDEQMELKQLQKEPRKWDDSELV